MAVKKAKAQKQDEASDFCAYIGPNLRGIVNSGTLYHRSRAEVLGQLKAVCEKYPEIAHLVVDGKHLAEARKNINKAGTLLHSKYESMRKRLTEGGKA